MKLALFSQSYTVLIEYYSKWVNSNSSLVVFICHLAYFLLPCTVFFYNLSSFFTVEQWYFDSFNRLLDGRDRWRAPAHTWAHFKQTYTQTYSYSFTIWLIYEFFWLLILIKFGLSITFCLQNVLKKILRSIRFMLTDYVSCFSECCHNSNNKRRKTKREWQNRFHDFI